MDLPSTLIARVQIPSANDFKWGLMHLKIIIIKDVLTRNKASGVCNQNTNRKQDKGKKCDLFLLNVMTLTDLQKYVKKVIKPEWPLGVLIVYTQHHILRWIFR